MVKLIWYSLPVNAIKNNDWNLENSMPHTKTYNNNEDNYGNNDYLPSNPKQLPKPGTNKVMNVVDETDASPISNGARQSANQERFN